MMIFGFLIVILAIAFFLKPELFRRREAEEKTDKTSPSDILKERLARGEITTEEYEKAREKLNEK